jgi:6-phosphogluconolactonase
MSQQVLVGSYSQSIAGVEIDADGMVSVKQQFSHESINNPSWLCISPNDKSILYASNEVEDFQGEEAGFLCAYRMQSGGNLELLNMVSTKGAWPCHAAIHPNGKVIFVANYKGGNIASYEILPTTGGIGKLIQVIDHGLLMSQGAAKAHAHQIVIHGDRVYAVDLGMNCVFSYPFDENTSQLNLNSVEIIMLPAAAGPRHLLFHPTEAVAFVLNELDSTISAIEVDSFTRRLKNNIYCTLSTLPRLASNDQMGAAEIQVSKSGKFIYCSNRDISNNHNDNHRNSIAVFQFQGLSSPSSCLQLIQHVSTHGVHPRHFTLMHNDSLLAVANQLSNSIVTYPVDVASGEIIDADHIKCVFHEGSVVKPAQLFLLP